MATGDARNKERFRRGAGGARSKEAFQGVHKIRESPGDAECLKTAETTCHGFLSFLNPSLDFKKWSRAS